MSNLKQSGICTICGNESKLKLKFSKEKILTELGLYWNSIPPLGILDTDYDILYCDNCEFEFSSPAFPGNNAFYSWIVGMKSYYSDNRWEFAIVVEKLKNKLNESLLDIGCGDGHFLDIVKKSLPRNNIHLNGLEQTTESIEAARKRGFNIFDFQVNSKISELISEKFDTITLFHVLEHVSDPLEFLRNILTILNQNGKVYISTPLSPMHFEKFGLDICNYPPHHLSRFSIKSYNEIAKKINCDIKCFTSPPSSILNRFFLCLRVGFKEINCSKYTLIKKMIKNPLFTLKVLFYSIKNVDKNTVLVEFSVK
jgi:SAM-dependent methyltransferase